MVKVHAFLVCALISSTLSMVCIVTAVATVNWMKLCLTAKMIVKLSKKLPVSNSYDFSKLSYSKLSICYLQGIFNNGIQVGSFKQLYPIPWTTASIVIHIIALASILGVITLLSGIVRFIISGVKEKDNPKESVAMSQKAALSILLAVLLLIVGMATFTATQAVTTNDPIKFLANFGQSMTSYDFTLAGYGRKRRAVISNQAVIQALRADVSGVHATFGFSFYVGWLSVIAAVSSIIFSFCYVHVLENADVLDDEQLPLAQVQRPVLALH